VKRDTEAYCSAKVKMEHIILYNHTDATNLRSCLY